MTVDELYIKLSELRINGKGDYEVRVDDVIYSHQVINNDLEIDDEDKLIGFTTNWD